MFALIKNTFQITAIAAIVMGSAAVSEAQSCRGSSADNLLACAHANIEACREEEGCNKDRRQALTVQDVLEAAAAKCCPLSARRERDCINDFAKGLDKARDKSPSIMKNFLAEARKEVLYLKENNCSTGTLGQV